MSNNSAYSRRDLLIGGGVVVALATLGFGCKKEQKALACTDTSGLKPDEVAARNSLAYVDQTPDPAKPCDACVQYVAAPSADACGSCKVVKGPINPKGNCKVWAAKT